MHRCDCANAQVDLSYRCRFYFYFIYLFIYLFFYLNVATQIITDKHLLESKFYRLYEQQKHIFAIAVFAFVCAMSAGKQKHCGTIRKPKALISLVFHLFHWFGFYTFHWFPKLFSEVPTRQDWLIGTVWLAFTIHICSLDVFSCCIL